MQEFATRAVLAQFAHGGEFELGLSIADSAETRRRRYT